MMELISDWHFWVGVVAGVFGGGIAMRVAMTLVLLRAWR